MATEITLCLEDDGTITVESGEKEESPEQEAAEGGNKTQVNSIEEAIQIVTQMAQTASMGPEETGEPTGMPEAEEPAAEEEAAMQAGFRPGVTGR